MVDKRSFQRRYILLSFVILMFIIIILVNQSISKYLGVGADNVKSGQSNSKPNAIVEHEMHYKTNISISKYCKKQ